jgi:hemolysin III
VSATAVEEVVPRLRGVLHAVAFLAALGAAGLIIGLAPGGTAAVAVAIYGAGLIALFGGSALYHRWPGPTRFKPLLRRIDHSTIFVFIAASYTPVALILIDGTIAWLVLVGAWAGAVAGVAFSLGWIDAPRSVVAGCYVALGWIGAIAAPQLVRALGPARWHCSLAAGSCTPPARRSTRGSARIPGHRRSDSTRSSMRSSSQPPSRTTSR